MQYELKNKRTGKLYFLDQQGIDDLKKLGLLSKYTIQELTSMVRIKSPLDFEIKKSSKTEKGETGRKQTIK